MTSSSSAASASLMAVVWVPKGKPTTLHTLTPEPASSFATRGTLQGLTQTEAKRYCLASSHRRTMSPAVAKGLR